MPKITIYNDSDEDIGTDFDVIEVIDGKEVSRKRLEPGSQPKPEQFVIAEPNQCFVVAPPGTAWPLVTETVEVKGYRRAPAKGKR